MNLLGKAPIGILMILSLSGFLTGEIVKCEYSRNKADSQGGVYQYTAYVSLICCFILWLISGFSLSASVYTVGMAVLFGIVVMGQIVASAFAMKIGSWAYTAVMMSLSTVIPALSGVLFYNEELGFNKIIGILLMSVCFILSVKTDEEDAAKKKNNIKWLLLSITASLSTGGIGILQKMHQSSAHKGEIEMFLVISFALSAIFSFVMMYIMNLKSNSNIKTKKTGFNPLIFVFAGVGTAFNHFINLYLSGAMESAVFFPVMSGGELIFVTIASILIFKDKLSAKQWIGLTCGILATVILCV